MGENRNGKKYVWVVATKYHKAYGGPEEGGWWYDIPQTVESRKVRKWDVQEVLAEMCEKYKRDMGVLVVEKIGVSIFGKPKHFPENRFQGRPYYE